MSVNVIPIKVGVRLRPLLQKELYLRKESFPKDFINIDCQNSEVIITENNHFKFDCVTIPDGSSNDELFEKCVKPILKSFFNGNNCTIFTYGQTGSGKTYTMGIEDPQKMVLNRRGIIPHSVEWLFNQIEAVEIRNMELPKVRVSFIEIYQDEIHDLLRTNPDKALVMMQDSHGEMSIKGITEDICIAVEDIYQCLKRGILLRHTDSTLMSEKSSRSHSIFTIILDQNLEDDASRSSNNKRMISKLHFVDLAGSERVSKTGNTGKKFKESISINSSLLALNTVIKMLTCQTKVNHIPYRQSKLTRILKDSLGGHAMTLMICCISPLSSDLYESINTLKYAAEARNIKNSKSMNWLELQKKLLDDTTEIKRKNGLQSQNTCRYKLSSQNIEMIEKLTILCQFASDIISQVLPNIRDSFALRRKFEKWLVMWKDVQSDVNKLRTSSDSSLSSSSLSTSKERCSQDDQSSIETNLKKATQILENLSSGFQKKDEEIKILQKQLKKLKQTRKKTSVDSTNCNNLRKQKKS